MDFLWKLIDDVQKTAFYTVVREFAVIDWVVLFFVLSGMLQGAKKGFVEMFARVLEILLIIVFTLSFYPLISAYLIKIIPALNREMADPVVFIPLAAVVWLLVGWVFNFAGKIFRVDVSSFLRFIGGVIFGGLYCALLLSFLVQVILFMPGEDIKKPFTSRGSYSGKTIASLAPVIQQFATAPFPGMRGADKKPAA
ncbi:MAG: Colicin V production protein [Candidatus Omnitrophica bacterium ADurb.Bin277]|nr:MAG: Colicin V production protein [Candidatus Omnitrophica bacterium ADurb.Bin277]